MECRNPNAFGFGTEAFLLFGTNWLERPKSERILQNPNVFSKIRTASLDRLYNSIIFLYNS